LRQIEISGEMVLDIQAVVLRGWRGKQQTSASVDDFRKGEASNESVKMEEGEGDDPYEALDSACIGSYWAVHFIRADFIRYTIEFGKRRQLALHAAAMLISKCPAFLPPLAAVVADYAWSIPTVLLPCINSATAQSFASECRDSTANRLMEFGAERGTVVKKRKKKRVKGCSPPGRWLEESDCWTLSISDLNSWVTGDNEYPVRYGIFRVDRSVIDLQDKRLRSLGIAGVRYFTNKSSGCGETWSTLQCADIAHWLSAVCFYLDSEKIESDLEGEKFWQDSTYAKQVRDVFAAAANHPSQTAIVRCC
jgi:hypothetical protein